MTQGENRELAWLIERLKEKAEGYRAEAIANKGHGYVPIGFAYTALGLELAIMEIELLQAVGIEGVCPSPEQPGR